MVDPGVPIIPIDPPIVVDPIPAPTDTTGIPTGDLPGNATAVPEPPAPSPTKTTPAKQSFLSWPTEVPYITSSYGNRMHPTLKVMRFHAGIDLRAYCGTPIHAAQSGIVVKREYFGTGGNMVMVDHGKDGKDSVMTRYLHLSKYNVKLNQWVSKGDVIGYSGMTGGISTGCHLHFEVYVNGSTVNPVNRLP